MVCCDLLLVVVGCVLGLLGITYGGFGLDVLRVGFDLSVWVLVGISFLGVLAVTLRLFRDLVLVWLWRLLIWFPGCFWWFVRVVLCSVCVLS